MQLVRHLHSSEIFFDSSSGGWVVQDRPHRVFEIFQTRSEAERFCLVLFYSLIERGNRALN